VGATFVVTKGAPTPMNRRGASNLVPFLNPASRV
jgi:hypothetical protein